MVVQTQQTSRLSYSSNRMSSLSQRNIWLFYLCAIILGLAQAWAFAPRSAWWLGLLSLILWCGLIHIRSYTARQAFLIGWFYGAAWFGKGTWWLYISLHTYGEMPWPLAGAAIILFSSVLALFPALSAWLYLKWRSRVDNRTLQNKPAQFTAIVFFASVFAGGEWLRGTLFTGFPWLASGYAQTDGPFAVLAPYIGVYGIAWVLALCAAAIVLCFHGKQNSRLSNCYVLIVISICMVLAPRFTWTQDFGKPLQVKLIQGNVPQETKFEPSRLLATIKFYEQQLSEASREKHNDLIITPETAFPVFFQQIPPETLSHLKQFATQNHTTLLLGAVGSGENDNPANYTNSVFTISEQDSSASTPNYHYDKHHLVPFGEFVPWGFRWFVNLMKIPLGDFTRGDVVQKPFYIEQIGIMPNICYEDVFGEEIARQMRNNLDAKFDTHILANVTNIGWFGDTEVIPQHLQISRMRSLELQRPMIRATNTGATAIIDANGDITQLLKPFTLAALEGKVQGRTGLTPYARWGNTFTLIVCLLGIGLALRFALRPPSSAF